MYRTAKTEVRENVYALHKTKRPLPTESKTTLRKMEATSTLTNRGYLGVNNNFDLMFFNSIAEIRPLKFLGQ